MATKVVAMTSLAMLLTGACSSGGDDASSADRSDAATSAEIATGDAGTISAVPAQSSVDLRANRSIIFVADLAIEAEDVADIVAKARELALEADGLVFGESSSYSDGDSAGLTIKVDPEQLATTLDALAKLGKETSRHQNADDVTGQVVDLDARIAGARVSVERVRGFLSETTDLVELSSVESELTRRETDLAVLVAQQRSLSDEVALATINLTISEPSKTIAASKPGDFVKDVPGFGSALASGVNALAAVLKVFAAVLGYVLPFAVVGSAIVMGVRAVRRTRSRFLPGPTAE